MALEALSTNGLFNFLICDTNNTSPNPCSYNNDYRSSETGFSPEIATLRPPEFCGGASDSSPSMMHRRVVRRPVGQESTDAGQNSAAQGRKKRRRRPKVCKNKEEAETQRMTHITVERNRRKQMNAHLAVLRSLMPESYVQRGDQASIVGGAVDYVKELEHILQSLEAQKLLLSQRERTTNVVGAASSYSKFLSAAPFAQFFAYPQYTWSQIPNMYPTKGNADAVADIEVTLIETHANLRILAKKSLRQLSKMVAGFQTLHLNILHLNVTTLDPLVLFSISAKVEEGCQLTSADEIAGAVHHVLRIIEEEATIC